MDDGRNMNIRGETKNATRKKNDLNKKKRGGHQF